MKRQNFLILNFLDWHYSAENPNEKLLQKIKISDKILLNKSSISIVDRQILQKAKFPDGQISWKNEKDSLDKSSQTLYLGWRSGFEKSAGKKGGGIVLDYNGDFIFGKQSADSQK